ncbi:MAG: acid phosphatase [Candidatus Eremiobacteraeota bacterium]|nr:acid phosphatase [Candidatus Eremiobacteraeota bacterium]
MWTSLALLLVGASPPASVGPHASHVTVVVMENRDYAAIAGNAQAPYFNRTLVPRGVLLQNAHAVTHPSEPNYLAIFSGSTQGDASDACPVTYASANLASELLAAGLTFGGYSESMPHDGFSGCYAGDTYARKHVPWASFSNVPASANRVYRGFPTNATPSVVFIVPNLCNDMHDCSTATGDAWLAKNVPPILAWDERNDGLLIVTWDEAEPDTGTNRVATLLAGPMIGAGTNDVQYADHYTVLHTIEAIFNLRCIAQECKAGVLKGIWK